MEKVTEIINKTYAHRCLDCGKCTSVCPVAKINHSFSPRSLLMRCVQQDHEAVLKDKMLWDCLTCGLCSLRCPSAIKYIEFMRDIRQIALNDGVKAECSHGGAFQSLDRIMTAANIKQNRMEWVTDDLKTTEKGDYLYFVGCAPYFDVFFADLKVESIGTAKGAIKLLNKMGITPVVLKDERCCGHDMLWTGDFDNFEKLAKHNLKLIEESGAKKVVFACPEGYQTFAQNYPDYFGELNFEVIHITELVAQKIERNELKFKEANKLVAFQDPCRLGRHMGVYDQPRTMLEAIPGVELKEMVKSKKKSICCGVGNWLTCGATAKTIQSNRLKEANQAGAKTLITACPKCEIHYKCAQQDKNLKVEVDIEVKDLITLVSELIE